MTITHEQFIKATGREPDNDDLERCNCENAGMAGHYSCGWNRVLNRPVFQVGPEDRMIEHRVSSVVETIDVLRDFYHLKNMGRPAVIDDMFVIVMGDGVDANAVTIESQPFAVFIRPQNRHHTACGFLAQHMDREGAPFLPLPVLRDDGADGTTVIGSVRRVVSSPDANTAFLMLN